MKKQKKLKIIYAIGCLLVFANASPVQGGLSNEDSRLPEGNLSLAASKSSALQQQGFTLTGVVKDSKGETLTGVSILVVGTKTGTVTDLDGKFTLTVPNKNTELQFSYLGFQTQKLKVGDRKTIQISLSEEDNVLEDVVIVAYGVQKKETVTGSLATISTKELLQSPQANISNSLVGRLPGLIAAQRSGQPGYDASTLRIRGIGTFASKFRAEDDDPQNPLIMIDGIESSNFNNIDPSEIESLTILKDASATAVYGVRGANGVILITTRRGELGLPRISFSTNVAATTFPFIRKSMSSADYATYYNMALQFDSYISQNYNPVYTQEEIDLYRSQSDPIFYPNMDWYDYMLKDYSYQTQSNFNISGGTERVRYFVSLGYFTQDGMFETSHLDPGYDYQTKFKRYNLRSNFDIDIFKHLTASFDISTQIGDIREPNWSVNSLMDALTRTLPMAAPPVIDNKIVSIPSGSGSPMGAFEHGWHRSYQNELDGSIRVKHKMDYLLKGLSLRGTVSYKNWNEDKKNYTMNGGYSYQATRDANGDLLILQGGSPRYLQYGWEVYRNRQIYMEGGAEYAQKFGLHGVTGLVLYNQKKYFNPNLLYHVPNGVQGIVGRVTYNYGDRYLGEINLGYNGTENFAKGRRFGFFPAYSLGWVVTNEPFFPENDYLSFMKIRGSYGTVGNDKIGGDRFLYRPTTYTPFGDTYKIDPGSTYYWGEQMAPIGRSGYIEGKLGNPLLTWERAVKKNLGADIKFWKNKLNLTVDYFEENRDNILWNMGTTPVVIGASMPAFNLGKMKNGGWEAEIAYNDRISSLNYFVKANYTYAHNEIVYMDEVVRTYPYRYQTGQRFGQFFGLVADGLFNSWEEVNDPNRPVYNVSGESGDLKTVQPGDIRYIDVNGDGSITEDDQVPIGYSNLPEVIFGVAIGGEWKGFDFSLLFQGADKVSNMPNRTFKQGFWEHTGANEDLLYSWTAERYARGETIKYPRFAADKAGANYWGSTYWLENARYLRLKNAEVGYSFRGASLRKIGVASIRFYVNGNNLITWCNLLPGEDPENPTMYENEAPYPPTRVINFGLNINF
jgi:TonB-linked SusC/RagA family outer membrane protein